MKKAFTLIELLVTVSIVLVLAVISIPAASNYGDKMAFANQINQIESLIGQTATRAKNPEKGITSYRFTIEDSRAVLSDSAGKELEKVIFSTGESVTKYHNSVLCDVPGDNCKFDDGTSADSQFFSVYKADFNPPLTKIVSLKFHPLRVTVSP